MYKRISGRVKKKTREIGLDMIDGAFDKKSVKIDGAPTTIFTLRFIYYYYTTTKLFFHFSARFYYSFLTYITAPQLE